MIDSNQIILQRNNLENSFHLLEPINKEVLFRAYDICTNIRADYETRRNDQIVNDLLTLTTAYGNKFSSLQNDFLLQIPSFKNLTMEHVAESQIHATQNLENRIKEYGFHNMALSSGHGLIEIFGHKPAFIFVLNYNKENPVHEQHTFAGYKDTSEDGNFSKGIGKNILDDDMFEYMKLLSMQDNATMLSEDGTVERVMTQLVNIDPSKILEKNPDYPPDYLMKAGGHSRFNSANGYSFWVPESPVMVLGEAGYLRIFKEGLSRFSSVHGEGLAISKFFGVPYNDY